MNTIKWHIRAIRQLNKIQHQDRVSIKDAVSTLLNIESARNVKRLTNHDYGYRLRVGRYRVLFDLYSDVSIIEIQEVKKRDESTY